MFTDEQIEALKTFADTLIAEAKEADERNKQVDAHTAKLEKLNKKVEKMAEDKGISLEDFQIQSEVKELSEQETEFKKFTEEVAVLAKEEGLDDFSVKKTS